jgi:hypothetical protein
MTDKRRLLLAVTLAIVFPLLGGGHAGNGGDRPALAAGIFGESNTGASRRGGGIFPYLNGGPDVSALQSPLDATDEEWIVINPILQRLVAAIDELHAADAGTLAPTNNAAGGFFGGMSNDTFDGPANIAPGERPSFNLFGTRSTTATTNPAATSSASQPAASQPSLTPTQPDLPRNEAGGTSDTLSLSQALTDLRNLLNSDQSTDAQIAARLTVVRDARAKTKRAADLAAEELLPLLTTDQQAVLVLLGYLR